MKLNHFPGGKNAPAPFLKRITLFKSGADSIWVFMANARVLVSDPLAEEGLEILRAAVDVDVRNGLPEDELCKIIGDYDALLVRSGTDVNARVIEAGRRLNSDNGNEDR